LALANVSCVWKDPECLRRYRTGISLHSHTHCSKERMHFVPVFTQRWRMVQRAADHMCRRSEIPVDFSRAYWTPPLSPQQVLDSERAQIENTLGLASLVSLTDHDSVEAPLLMRQSKTSARVPASLEWSVPFGRTIFHLGIHNLPPEQVQQIAAELDVFTQRSSDRTVTELLAWLHSMPDVLIVFNHPFWNMYGFEMEEHAQHLDGFLQRNIEFIHAMELNGMRRREENKRVIPLAERWRRPLISGGDRHACEPNANVNLSDAQSFAEFVHEIRYEQRSHLLFLPQYLEPMCVRVIRSVLDTIRYYPEHPADARAWDDRVFHPVGSGEIYQSLSSLWDAPPGYMRSAFSLFRLAESASVQWALKRIYADAADSIDAYAFAGSASGAGL
jgi:hypothetical protein